MKRGALTSLEDLRNWFYAVDGHYVVLARGCSSNFTASNKIFTDSSSSNKDEAWERLEFNIETSARNGGDFSIKVQTGPNSSATGVTQHLTLRTSSENGVNGIGGVMSPAAITQQIDKAVSEALEKQELRQTIADLEATIEGIQNETPIKMLGNQLLQHPELPNLIGHGLDALANVATAWIAKNGARVGIIGVPGSPEITEDEIADTQATAYDYDLPRLSTALEKIRVHFAEPEAIIEKVANLIEAHPEKVKTLLNNPGLAAMM